MLNVTNEWADGRAALPSDRDRAGMPLAEASAAVADTINGGVGERKRIGDTRDRGSAARRWRGWSRWPGGAVPVGRGPDLRRQRQGTRPVDCRRRRVAAVVVLAAARSCPATMRHVVGSDGLPHALNVQNGVDLMPSTLFVPANTRTAGLPIANL
jgi:hypothetical protein